MLLFKHPINKKTLIRMDIWNAIPHMPIKFKKKSDKWRLQIYLLCYFTRKIRSLIFVHVWNADIHVSINFKEKSDTTQLGISHTTIIIYHSHAQQIKTPIGFHWINLLWSYQYEIKHFSVVWIFYIVSSRYVQHVLDLAASCNTLLSFLYFFWIVWQEKILTLQSTPGY